MVGHKIQPGNSRPSVKYRRNQVNRASFEVTDYVYKEYAANDSEHKKGKFRKSEPKSPAILSTSELISTFGQIWDYAIHLAITQPKKNLDHYQVGCQKEHLVGKESERPVNLAGSQDFRVDLRTARNLLSTVQPKLEFPKITQKINTCKPFGDFINSLSWRLLQGGIDSNKRSWERKEIRCLRISDEFGYMYGWMSEIIPEKLRYPVNISMNANKNAGECCVRRDADNTSRLNLSGDTTTTADVFATPNVDVNSTLIESKESSPFINKKPMIDTRTVTSSNSNDFLEASQGRAEDGSVSKTQTSIICEAYHTTASNDTHEEYQCEANAEVLEDRRKLQLGITAEDGSRAKTLSQGHLKSLQALAKKEHAFSGALAGIFVSVCLHPVDTVKTVIQSCHAEQKSISCIGKSIVSERGLSGLYRGITSNIASSAPISAVYTFTYESVKGAFLPLLPKEYSSFAHCMAGGCASIATSFIFTPSERIKQQMQVGTHYRNCWNALIEVLGKGGLPSLYVGWGAVLCRNIPHSIIKFYTYENLKKLTMFPEQSTAQPNTFQTLVCGGLAGSTAALFTTPFDVVKTRLQTEIPGSMSRYDNVFHALKEIGKNEGLNGLYKGLMPRLVMYVSQGALFFASYEFFKSINDQTYLMAVTKRGVLSVSSIGSFRILSDHDQPNVS